MSENLDVKCQKPAMFIYYKMSKYKGNLKTITCFSVNLMTYVEFHYHEYKIEGTGYSKILTFWEGRD